MNNEDNLLLLCNYFLSYLGKSCADEAILQMCLIRIEKTVFSKGMNIERAFIHLDINNQ